MKEKAFSQIHKKGARKNFVLTVDSDPTTSSAEPIEEEDEDITFTTSATSDILEKVSSSPDKSVNVCSEVTSESNSFEKEKMTGAGHDKKKKVKNKVNDVQNHNKSDGKLLEKSDDNNRKTNKRNKKDNAKRSKVKVGIERAEEISSTSEDDDSVNEQNANGKSTERDHNLTKGLRNSLVFPHGGPVINVDEEEKEDTTHLITVEIYSSSKSTTDNMDSLENSATNKGTKVGKSASSQTDDNMQFSESFSIIGGRKSTSFPPFTICAKGRGVKVNFSDENENFSGVGRGPKSTYSTQSKLIKAVSTEKSAEKIKGNASVKTSSRATLTTEKSTVCENNNVNTTESILRLISHSPEKKKESMKQNVSSKKTEETSIKGISKSKGKRSSEHVQPGFHRPSPNDSNSVSENILEESMQSPESDITKRPLKHKSSAKDKGTVSVKTAGRSKNVKSSESFHLSSQMSSPDHRDLIKDMSQGSVEVEYNTRSPEKKRKKGCGKHNSAAKESVLVSSTETRSEIQSQRHKTSKINSTLEDTVQNSHFPRKRSVKNKSRSKKSAFQSPKDKHSNSHASFGVRDAEQSLKSPSQKGRKRSTKGDIISKMSPVSFSTDAINDKQKAAQKQSDIISSTTSNKKKGRVNLKKREVRMKPVVKAAIRKSFSHGKMNDINSLQSDPPTTSTITTSVDTQRKSESESSTIKSTQNQIGKVRKRNKKFSATPSSLGSVTEVVAYKKANMPTFFKEGAPILKSPDNDTAIKPSTGQAVSIPSTLSRKVIYIKADSPEGRKLLSSMTTIKSDGKANIVEIASLPIASLPKPQKDTSSPCKSPSKPNKNLSYDKKGQSKEGQGKNICEDAQAVYKSPKALTKRKRKNGLKQASQSSSSPNKKAKLASAVQYVSI